MKLQMIAGMLVMMTGCSSLSGLGMGLGTPVKPLLDTRYDVENGRAAGIVRAMSDGRRMIIQTSGGLQLAGNDLPRDFAPLLVTVTDQDGWTIPLSRVGPYLVLARLEPVVHVRVGDTEAVIRPMTVGQ